MRYAAILIPVLFVLSFSPRSLAQDSHDPAANYQNSDYDIPDGNSIIIGNPKARVTLVEFADLQCPYCRQLFPAIQQIMEAYPDDVRLVVKHFPAAFHPNAKGAAKIALAAHGQGKYYEMMDALYQSGADISEAAVKQNCASLGISYDLLKADLQKNDAVYEGQIQEDMGLAAEIKLRIRPDLFINGHFSLARDFPSLKKEIDGILQVDAA